MRIQKLEVLRNFFHKPELPYTLYVRVQGTECELKDFQKKIVELV